MLATRITRARAAAGLSLRELSQRVGVSHTAIAKFEHGELVPSSDILLGLARATGVKVEFFFRPDTVTLGQPAYRKRARLGVKALAKVEAEILDQVERVVELLGFFPEPPIPTFSVPAELPFATSLDAIEDVALQVRAAWDLGENPISDLMGTLEELGVLVLTTPGDPAQHFDGLAAEVMGLPLVVVGTEWTGDRQRFTLAHELGHLVLRGRLAKEIDEEQACNRFAGAFLVPRPAVVAELGPRRRWLEPRELSDLKHRFGMSMGAWTFRARDTGVIALEPFTVLQRMFRSRGWHKREPGQAVPAERTSHFRRLVLRALAEDLIGEGKAAELLGTSLTHFQAWRTFGGDANAPVDQ